MQDTRSYSLYGTWCLAGILVSWTQRISLSQMSQRDYRVAYHIFEHQRSILMKENGLIGMRQWCETSIISNEDPQERADSTQRGDDGSLHPLYNTYLLLRTRCHSDYSKLEDCALCSLAVHLVQLMRPLDHVILPHQPYPRDKQRRVVSITHPRPLDDYSRVFLCPLLLDLVSLVGSHSSFPFYHVRNFTS